MSGNPMNQLGKAIGKAGKVIGKGAAQVGGAVHGVKKQIEDAVANAAYSVPERDVLIVVCDGKSTELAGKRTVQYVRDNGQEAMLIHAEEYRKHRYEVFNNGNKVILIGHHSIVEEEKKEAQCKYNDYGMSYGVSETKCVLRAIREKLHSRSRFAVYYGHIISNYKDLAQKYMVPMRYIREGAEKDRSTLESQYDLLWLLFAARELPQFLGLDQKGFLKETREEVGNPMLGAAIGDIVGSRFEHHNRKSKWFGLFTQDCKFTDDTVMTLAIAEAFLQCKEDRSDLAEQTIKCMQKLGRKYPNAGYGGSFRNWLKAKCPEPYNSYGNGSAMRVSPCAYAADTLEEALKFAETTTVVSHIHPDARCGARAVAGAVFLALHGADKAQIKKFVEENCYPMDFTLDEIRSEYRFDVSCRGSVPQAIEAFLESTDFEDAIRNAVSIGGDSDTIAAISGSIAAAYYGVPVGISAQALLYLDWTCKDILNRFEAKYQVSSD